MISFTFLVFIFISEAYNLWSYFFCRWFRAAVWSPSLRRVLLPVLHKSFAKETLRLPQVDADSYFIIFETSKAQRSCVF